MASGNDLDRNALLSRLEVPGPDRTALLTRDTLHRLIDCLGDDEVVNAITALAGMFEVRTDESRPPTAAARCSRSDREAIRRTLSGELPYVTFEEWSRSVSRRIAAEVFRILRKRGRLRRADLTA